MVLSVPPKTAGVTVTLVASLRRALEWFLVSVSQKVAVQMVLSLEGLVADRAQVLPLVTVSQSVLGQGRGIAEHFVTETALLRTGLAVPMGRGVGQHVRRRPAGLVTGGRAWGGREDGIDIRYSMRRCDGAGNTVGLVDAE